MALSALDDHRAMATINVRIPQSLKLGGETVLEREGVSVSDAIRSFYTRLEKQQEIPEWVKREGTQSTQEAIAEKRTLLKSLVGTIPSETTLEQIKDSRLEKQLRSGLR